MNDLQDRAQRYRRLAEMLSGRDAEIVIALASELEAVAETGAPRKRTSQDKRLD